MVYSIDLFATNLTPYNWTLADPAAVTNWGSVAQQPQPVLSGQSNVPIGRFEAAKGTWTGTDGVVLFNDGFPWNNGLVLTLGVKMPFVGDNKCIIGESALSWFQGEDNVSYFVEALFDSEVATSDRVAYDGYHLWCTIDQGTQVTANIYMTPIDNAQK